MPVSPPIDDIATRLTRRHFFARNALGLGAAALTSLGGSAASAEPVAGSVSPSGGILRELHAVPSAKRVIYLFMHGGPSQLDLFDHKPELIKHHGEELPASVRKGQRITGMT